MEKNKIRRKIPDCDFLEISIKWQVRKVWNWAFKIKLIWWRFVVVAQSKLLGKIYYKSMQSIMADIFLWRQEEIKNRKNVIICHKNDIPIDNRLDNLYLWDHKSNAADYKRNKNNPIYIKYKKYSKYINTGFRF